MYGVLNGFGLYVVPNTCTFSEHYKWALDELFIKHNFARVIILEGLTFTMVL